MAVSARKRQGPKPVPAGESPVRLGPATLAFGDAIAQYESWPAPTCIISDGPYGLGKFPGEPVSSEKLGEWYAPHVAAWTKHAAPNATLWFWCSELAWARVHPVLELHGWDYEELCVWDKGIAHIAGNVNSKTIRGMPVVTEVAVRYTKRVLLRSGTEELPMKEWLRAEWQRSGLPLYRSNEACGVANAATRKYLTQCHLWYFPPGEAVVKMAEYCSKHGEPTSEPYFSLDRKTPVTAEVWDSLRAKWNHTHAVTNVWSEPPVHGDERIKGTNGYLHATQKPLSLMQRQVLASTDPGDVVWEPFGGLCSGAVAAIRHGRQAFAAEVNPEYFGTAAERLAAEARSLGFLDPAHHIAPHGEDDREAG